MDKQEQSNRNKTQTSENRNSTQPNNTQSNNTERTLSQEQTIYQENVKRIMNGKKLPYHHEET